MEDNNEMDLPFEQQMEMQASIKRMQEMADHADELCDRLARYWKALDDAETLAIDPELCRRALFEHAEYFDSLEKITDSDLAHEQAKEIDWLRHVVDDYPEIMEFAVETLRTCVAGDIDGALRKFNAAINVRPEEFNAIADYWREALED